MSSIRIANAPCSWGVLEFDLEGEAKVYAEVLDEMAGAGYAGTELGDWEFMPSDPVKLREELSKRQLVMLAAFVPVALTDAGAHEQGAAVALRTARLLAAVAQDPLIVLADNNGTVQERVNNAGRITPEMGLSERQWDSFARGAELVARQVMDQTGVRTVFHHHCAGYVETPTELDTLLERTDPKLLGLCFDTGHFAYGGGDPVEGLRRHAERIWHVHFKDCHPRVAQQSRREGWNYFEAVQNGVFCELGRGEVDFRAVLLQLHEMNYSGWIVVEQDVLPGMGSPLESARRNREFLRGLGL